MSKHLVWCTVGEGCSSSVVAWHKLWLAVLRTVPLVSLTLVLASLRRETFLYQDLVFLKFVTTRLVFSPTLPYVSSSPWCLRRPLSEEWSKQKKNKTPSICITLQNWNISDVKMLCEIFTNILLLFKTLFFLGAACLPVHEGVNQTRHCSLEKYSAVLWTVSWLLSTS